MKRVLITGASGFIGRHCLSSALANHDEVHAISSKIQPEPLPGVRWHTVDLLDPSQVRALMAKVQPTHLLHFAWYVVPGKYLASLENHRWVQASLNLMEAFVSQGGQRAVMAGTCIEYDWKYGYCSEYLTPRSPDSVYGACKNALQIMFHSFIKQTGLSGAWGRIFFLYGPHEHPARLVPSAIRSLLQGDPARCSHGNQIRDYLHVQDVADAFVALLGSNVQGPVNIASGRPVTIKSIVCKIARNLDREAMTEFGVVPSPANEPPLVVANVDRVLDEVGWRPKYDFDRGLEQTIEWWQNQLKTRSWE